jgi:hypothetical protein
MPRERGLSVAVESSPARVTDRACGVDQADVTEGLREVPERFSRHRVDLFGEEADVVGV